MSVNICLSICECYISRWGVYLLYNGIMCTQGWETWPETVTVIFQDYILTNDICLHIFKTPQKHFINARAGTQNQTLNKYKHNKIFDR